VLKHNRYSDYLEEQDNPISICSLHAGSLDLILQLVS